ncbi:COMM domain-containing protein 10 isoform X2 [Tursiops truncatus]|nr:COMM domain-containing protein 10 isoform X2 [Tursiops truncatus]XP_033708989.1 COMM domain-containing protein 10 isoform X2 [Tursiops truncatus]
MKKAVSLINEIDIGRFPRLLTRILQKLHLKAENSFSEEEEEKLQAAFSLERQDLHLVLETISFILEQAVYYNVKPAALQQQLENIHLRQDKAEAFVSAWSSVGQETIEKFRQRILAPHKLETVGWQLNLQMAHSAQAKLKSPQAVLQLGVSNEDSKIKTVSPGYSWAIWMHPFQLGELPGTLPRKSLKKVLVEFSHKELFDFYNKDCRCGTGVADGRKFLSQTNQHVLNFHPLQLFPASSPYESVAAPG